MGGPEGTFNRSAREAACAEDHPLDYIDFEGVIPEGHYGAGSVIVWDTGPYRILSRSKPEASLEEKLERGHVTVWLEGRKIRGGYALTRVARGREERWILVKMKDEGADARRNPVRTQPESVLTGRTNEEVAEAER